MRPMEGMRVIAVEHAVADVREKLGMGNGEENVPDAAMEENGPAKANDEPVGPKTD